MKKRGFDLNHFASFLANKRDNGTNVDVWTKEELQKVVFEFSTLHSESVQPKNAGDQWISNVREQSVILDEVPQSPLRQQKIIRPVGQPDDKAGEQDDVHSEDEKPLQSYRNNQNLPQKPVSRQKWQDPNLKVVLAVKQATKVLVPTRLSELAQNNLEVQVLDGLVGQKKSLFKTEYSLSFKVKMPHLKSDLRRSDEEFDSLAAYLSKAYPNVIPAPIKPFKATKQTASRYINKRQLLLTRFLRHTLRNSLLRGDPFLMIFLAETDEKKYKQALQTMAKQDKVRVLDDLVTFDGHIELTQQQAQDIVSSLLPKVVQAAQSTEKTTLFLAENMKRMGLDFMALGKTAENISDCFKTLLRTSYLGTSEAEDDGAKHFLKASMEVFSQYAAHMQNQGQYFTQDVAKFYEFSGLQGERIGQMQRNIQELSSDYAQRTGALAEKQQKMFNLKDVSKWGNPDLARMVLEDQKELFKDVKNAQLILPQEQQDLWKQRQLICTLVSALQQEMVVGQEWSVYDMRQQATEMSQKMKEWALGEQGSLWADYDRKITR